MPSSSTFFRVFNIHFLFHKTTVYAQTAINVLQWKSSGVVLGTACSDLSDASPRHVIASPNETSADCSTNAINAFVFPTSISSSCSLASNLDVCSVRFVCLFDQIWPIFAFCLLIWDSVCAESGLYFILMCFNGGWREQSSAGGDNIYVPLSFVTTYFLLLLWLYKALAVAGNLRPAGRIGPPSYDYIKQSGGKPPARGPHRACELWSYIAQWRETSGSRAVTGLRVMIIYSTVGGKPPARGPYRALLIRHNNATADYT